MERHNEKRTEPDRVLVRGTGPAGRLARAGVGLALIALALFWRDPDWMDAVLGLLVAPAVLLGAMAWRARRAPEPLRATGPPSPTERENSPNGVWVLSHDHAMEGVSRRE